MATTEFYIYSKLTLKLKVSPYTTETLYFGNESAEEGDLYVGSPKIFKLINPKTISDLGASMDVVLPKKSGGSLVLENTRGSLRFDKRLSDYIENYAFVKQPLDIYTFKKQSGAIGVIADEEHELSGVVSGLSFDRDKITLNFKAVDFSTESPQYLINDTKFPNAPGRTLDSYLPIVFGDQEVIAYSVTDEDSDDFNKTTGDYLYASTFGDDFVNGGVQNYYIKDNVGRYVEIMPGATINTVVFDSLSGGGYVSNIWEVTDRAQKISSSQGYWSDRCRVHVNDGGNAARDTDLTLKIYAYNKTNQGSPLRKIYEETINSEAAVNATGNFYYIEFSLTDIIAVGPNKGFYASLSRDPKGGADNISPVTGDSGVSDVDLWVIDDFDDNASLRKTTGKPWKLEFFGPSITDVPTPVTADIDATTGLGFSKFTITRSGSDGVGPDITSLDMIVKARGLKDDSSGTIVSANQNLNTAPLAVKLLYYKQNGDSLTGFDDTTYSPATYLTTNINGASSKKTTYRELIKDILRQNVSKLIPRKDNKLSYWAYGYTTGNAPDAVITESDCAVKGFYILGEDNIVNAAKFAYDKRQRPLNVEDIQGRDISNFLKVLELRKGTDAALDLLVGESWNIYGLKEPQEAWEKLTWLNDSTSVRNFGEYLFTIFAKERLHVNIEIPYHKNNYKNIQVWDYVRFSHIDLSSDSGTESSNTAKNPIYFASELDNYFLGFLGRRARSVDMRVISRRVSFKSNQEHTLKLSLQILDNDAEVY